MGLWILGSSLTFSAQGGRGKEKKNVAAKNSVRPRKNTAEGGCGGNSAVFLQKIEASPAACIVRGRSQQKSFLFLLEEKIRRAQKKSRENFFAGSRALASGGGAASFVGIGLVKSSDFIQEGQQNKPAFGGVCFAARNRTDCNSSKFASDETKSRSFPERSGGLLPRQHRRH